MIRAIPWILAVAGVLIPLATTGMGLWPLTVVWLLVLGVAATLGRAILAGRRATRIVVAIALLPALVLLTFEGGLWLLPAVVAWLVIEILEPA